MNENINTLLGKFKRYCQEENPERVRELNKSIVSYYKRNGLTQSENFACHMYNLSLFYINTDDLSSALKHGKTAQSIAKKLNSDRLNAKFSDNLGTIYSYLGDNNTGLFWFKKAYGIITNFPGLFSDGEKCTVYLNLGSSLIEKNRYTEALKFHKKTLNLKKEKDLEYANILNLIGYDYEKALNFSDAAKYLRSALDIMEKYCYDDDDDYIANMCYIANVYKEDGNFEKALTAYERTIFLMKKAGLGGEPFFGEVLNKTAELYSETGNDKRAVELRISALKIFEKRIGNKNIFYANCLKEIAEIYRRNSVYGPAISYLQRALDIKGALMSFGDEDYRRDFILLADLYYKNNQKERSVEFYEYLLANINENNPDYKRVITGLAAKYRLNENGTGLFELYYKYKKVFPSDSFDDFLGMAEAAAELWPHEEEEEN